MSALKSKRVNYLSEHIESVYFEAGNCKLTDDETDQNSRVRVGQRNAALQNDVALDLRQFARLHSADFPKQHFCRRIKRVFALTRGQVHVEHGLRHRDFQNNRLQLKTEAGKLIARLNQVLNSYTASHVLLRADL